MDRSTSVRQGALASLDRGRLIRLAAFALLILLCSYAGAKLTLVTGHLVVMRIANAISVMWLLKSARRETPGLLLLQGLASGGGAWLAGVQGLVCLLSGSSGMLEVALIVLPLRYFCGACDFTKARTQATFYLLALGPATLIPAALYATALNLIAGPDIAKLLPILYFGGVSGLTILVPPLMTAQLRDYREIFAKDERGGTLLALSAMVLTIALKEFCPALPFAILLFPVVLLLTFTRGFAGGAIGVLAADLSIVPQVLMGHAPLIMSHYSLPQQVMIALSVGAVLSFTMLLTGSALASRRRLERGLALALTRAEEAREEALVAKDAAEAANRSKSMFLASMSHELRTPLNAVLGFSEVMKSEMFGALGHERYRDYAGLIHGAGAHLLDLINDVLDMSKIEAGKFEIDKTRLDVRSVIDDSLKLMGERAAAARIRLVRQMPDVPAMLMADGRALKQILLNLLSNAVKFTPEGGQVTVCLIHRPHAGVCRIEVRDTGVGIPPDAIARLGNPFVQVRGGVGTAHQGTGLGLALVRNLAELHGGILKIESTLGAGTNVAVEMPIGSETEATASAA